MANVLLGVTGSVAAIRTPALYDELTRRGHHVRCRARVSPLMGQSNTTDGAIILIRELAGSVRD